MRALLLLWLLAWTSIARAEQIGADIRSITVLPPTDVTGLNVSQQLQQYIGEYLYGTRQFVVQYSAYSLPSFTAKDLQQTFERLDSQLILFPYFEPQRMSLFLFDSGRPQEFVAASVPYSSAQSTVLTPELIQNTFPAAFDALMNAFYSGQYQPLPGANVTAQAQQGDDRTYTRELFRELSSLKESSTFAGANIGIARLAGGGAAASVVNLTLYGGYSLSENLDMQLSLDIFNYLFPSLRANYRLPFLKEKLISVHALFGAGTILGTVADHRGFPSENMKKGGLFFGPGLGLHIPLAGADIRADVRFFLGSGTLFFTTYGLTYYL